MSDETRGDSRTPDPSPPARPYPKSAQLARGERRYRRKIAGPIEWAAINVAKVLWKPCRLSGYTPCYGTIERHHLVSRSRHGDDEADNIVPLCKGHHGDVTRRASGQLRALAESLTDAECAYVLGRLGEGGMERLFRVRRA